MSDIDNNKKYTLAELETLMFDAINEYAEAEVEHQLFFNSACKGELKSSDEYLKTQNESLLSNIKLLKDKKDTLIQEYFLKHIKIRETQEHFNSKINFEDTDYINTDENGNIVLELSDIDLNNNIYIYQFGERTLYANTSKEELEIIIKKIANEWASKIVEYRIYTIREKNHETKSGIELLKQSKIVLADIDTLNKNKDRALLSYQIRCITDKLKDAKFHIEEEPDEGSRSSNR